MDAIFVYTSYMIDITFVYDRQPFSVRNEVTLFEDFTPVEASQFKSVVHIVTLKAQSN